MASGDVDGVQTRRSGRGVGSMPVTPPPGLQAIYAECSRVYPDQRNPLQVAAVVKYWFGGPDPLDYISMYVNSGDVERRIPAHWHYVTFGLSDLHGDGRVHEGAETPDCPSGFGFELTFRLRREACETAPPTWPAALLQALARYVFQSGNSLCPGDHIPWRRSLDGSESRIQHMLMASDAQLHQITTPFGTVNFVQVVGVCEEELKAAQHWNGPGVLTLIQSIPGAGGSWLITDMRRGETIFEINPHLQEQVDDGIEVGGSNLSGVSGQCMWEDTSCKTGADSSHQAAPSAPPPHCTDDVDDDDKENVRSSGSGGVRHRGSTVGKVDLATGGPRSILPPIKSGPRDGDEQIASQPRSQRRLAPDRLASAESSRDNIETSEVLQTRTFDSIHITLNIDTGSLLPLALRGRLKHGRHFTFKSSHDDVAITLVSSSVAGTIVTEEMPYAAHGSWLQVLLRDDFIDKILADISDIGDVEQLTAPRQYSWHRCGLSITLLPNSV